MAMNRLSKKKSRYRKINIVIEKDDYGYYAYCPELPGCQSQGDTFEEIMLNIREAAELYVETLNPEEVAESLSKEIYNTTLEVAVSQNDRSESGINAFKGGLYVYSQ